MSHPRTRSPVSDFGFRARTLLSILALPFALNPPSLLACAACYGQSDSPMAAGMNWGILSLLAVVAVVLAGVAAFFVYLARRSAAFAADSATERPTPTATAPDFEAVVGRNAAFVGQGITIRGRLPHKCGAPGAARGSASARLLESTEPLL